jgi:hypothetical protein
MHCCARGLFWSGHFSISSVSKQRKILFIEKFRENFRHTSYATNELFKKFYLKFDTGDFRWNFVGKFRLSGTLMNNKASLHRGIIRQFSVSRKPYHRFVQNRYRTLPPKAVSHFQFTAIWSIIKPSFHKGMNGFFHGSNGIFDRFFSAFQYGRFSLICISFFI